MKTLLSIVRWGLRLFISGELFKAAYLKLTAKQGAVAIFTLLHMEPVGRYTIGMLELLTALFILYPKATGVSAIGSAFLMVAVIFYHLTKLGVAIGGDATLFVLASAVFLASVILIYLERTKLKALFMMLKEVKA